VEVSESHIQGLKAQEAKDLCIELLHQLRAKEKAPISPGEVQMKELEFELRLKEAEAEDNRRHAVHLEQIKSLELQIEQERTRQAEAQRHADRVRQEHAQMVAQVASAEESLSVQFQRATRQQALKLERLETEYAARAEELRRACEELQQQKTQLSEEIANLTQLRETAADIGQLHEELAERQAAAQRQLQGLDEELEAADFERKKRLRDMRRKQELELAELEAQHKKQVIQLNRKAAEELLAALDLTAVSKLEWEQYQRAGTTETARRDEELCRIREQARAELRREYNITMPEAMDVTDLFYNHKALTNEAQALRKQLDKLEVEIHRMREHIEQEPRRIAAAVEAAKVQIQNTIEQAAAR